MLIGQPDVRSTQDRQSSGHSQRSQLPHLSRLEGRGKGPELIPCKINGRTNIALLYFSYHIMVGLGTLFIAIAVVAAFFCCGAASSFRAAGCCGFCCWRCRSPTLQTPPDGLPPNLAASPGWSIGLMRTADGYSKMVSAGNGMFTLLGFMGMYTVLGILFLFLVRREIEQGPEAETVSAH